MNSVETLSREPGHNQALPDLAKLLRRLFLLLKSHIKSKTADFDQFFCRQISGTHYAPRENAL